MADDASQIIQSARERAYATPLDQFHVADVGHFTSDTYAPWFERLRAEDPVHYCPASEYGPYWSVTKFQDIVAVDSNHEAFSSSSELGGITIMDAIEPNERSSFIGLDPPAHDAQRRVVTPMFSTPGIANLEPLIRSRAAAILDELPVGETFDFVDKVSVELTSQMLATLFDFPFEERRLLPEASDMILARPADDDPRTLEERQAAFMPFVQKFVELWEARKDKPGSVDLLSLLAGDPVTRKDELPFGYIGNVVLLTVAGSDTTRHSITGALMAFQDYPEAYDRLRADPALLDSAVPEIIRWQSPVAHMRRTATRDIELGGKRIRKGDKVVMWYVSGNRDGDVIPDPDRFIIDRERPRQHVAFGFGIHRCVGNRLAEMQLKVVWEEILKRFKRIEVVGAPRRLNSNFVKGYEALPVRIVA
ncbi:cytochrome P450 [uncultured Phenylobacterium sp.]|uniref:cytochrome P450 n=1 Tax=uncultured Phenylobacterium sp. TaxID=349273 RepID=UPI0025F1ECEE|nr:cytochrome P450 [uncultured Phenylobacterium sp.]